MELTQQFVRELFDYDPETGAIVRRTTNARAGWLGKNGYWYVSIRTRKFLVHRVIWCFVYGSYPARIDHLDGDPTNNRLLNLRAASHQQNMCNRKKRPDAVLKGVTRYPAHKTKPFQASIKVGGKKIHLGYYTTAEEAHEAYWAAAQKHFGEFARKE